MFTLTYDSEALTFREARIGGINISVIERDPGLGTFSFNGLTPVDELLLQISFDQSAERIPAIQVDGFFLDSNDFPILELHESARLDGILPEDFVLHQNIPNPFNPATQIRYALPYSGLVRLTIYNALGQEITRLVESSQEAGFHVVQWNAEGLATGTYYYRLEASGFEDTRKMMLLK